VHSMSCFFSKTSYKPCVYAMGCEAVMAREPYLDSTTLLLASAGAHRAAASTDRCPPAPGLTVREYARCRQHAPVCRLRSPGPGEQQWGLPWTAHRTRSAPAPRQQGQQPPLGVPIRFHWTSPADLTSRVTAHSTGHALAPGGTPGLGVLRRRSPGPAMAAPHRGSWRPPGMCSRPHPHGDEGVVSTTPHSGPLRAFRGGTPGYSWTKRPPTLSARIRMRRGHDTRVEAGCQVDGGRTR
jgi:hypothetical protein